MCVCTKIQTLILIKCHHQNKLEIPFRPECSISRIYKYIYANNIILLGFLYWLEMCVVLLFFYIYIFYIQLKTSNQPTSPNTSINATFQMKFSNLPFIKPFMARNKLHRDRDGDRGRERERRKRPTSVQRSLL